MKDAIITGIFTIIAAVISSIISWQLGKTNGVNEVTNYVSEALAPVFGDNNTVTVNDISTFVSDYEDAKDENEQIRELNANYVNQLAQYADEVNSLTAQMGETPILNYQDLSLSIEGEDIAVNSKDAMVIIDSKEYISKEIAEKLLDDRQSVFYKNNTMYVGKIIADKANLFEQWNVNLTGASMEKNVYDSYGNLHQDALELYNNTCNATYNLNRKYTNLKFSMAIKDGGSENYVGVITIKADDNVVYTSPDLSKTTEPITVSDVALDNCSLLKIEYSNNGGWSNRCLMFDASVYN